MEEYNLKKEYELLLELYDRHSKMEYGEESDYFLAKFVWNQQNLVNELRKEHPKTKYYQEILDNYTYGLCPYTQEIIISAQEKINRIILEEL